MKLIRRFYFKRTVIKKTVAFYLVSLSFFITVIATLLVAQTQVSSMLNQIKVPEGTVYYLPSANDKLEYRLSNRANPLVFSKVENNESVIENITKIRTTEKVKSYTLFTENWFSVIDENSFYELKLQPINISKSYILNNNLVDFSTLEVRNNQVVICEEILKQNNLSIGQTIEVPLVNYWDIGHTDNAINYEKYNLIQELFKDEEANISVKLEIIGTYSTNTENLRSNIYVSEDFISNYNLNIRNLRQINLYLAEEINKEELLKTLDFSLSVEPITYEYAMLELSTSDSQVFADELRFIDPASKTKTGLEIKENNFKLFITLKKFLIAITLMIMVFALLMIWSIASNKTILHLEDIKVLTKLGEKKLTLIIEMVFEFCVYVTITSIISFQLSKWILLQGKEFMIGVYSKQISILQINSDFSVLSRFKDLYVEPSKILSHLSVNNGELLVFITLISISIIVLYSILIIFNWRFTDE